MFKIVDPLDFDFHGEQVLYPVKVSRRGLRGNDKNEFRKRASDDLMRKVANTKLFPDELLVHGLAVADHETTGFNRKGDGWTRKECEDRHHTFVKYARWYRNHDDEDPTNSFGRVVASMHNPDMGRIELLAGLSSNKTAADRNKGKVASYEINRLEAGDDLPISMGARVAHDVCGVCKNKAKTAADYCTAATCPGGGCAEHLGQVVKVGNDMVQMGVFNPDSYFVDISTVHRPAGRTSYATISDFAKKRADGGIIGSAQLALLMGIRGPSWVMTNDAGPESKMRFKIASLLCDFSEEEMPAHVAYQWHCDLPQLSKIVTARDLPDQLAALADRGIFANLNDFAALSGRVDHLGAARSCLFDMYKEARDTCDSYDPRSDRWAKADSKNVNMASTVSKVAGELGIEFGYTTRAIRSSVSPRRPTLSSVSVTAEGRKLASDYVDYRLAALSRYLPSAVDISLTLRGTIAQDI